MKKMTAIFLTLAMILFCLCACKTEKPPKEDTPAPPAHDGLFVSDYGTLEFDGDGESVKVIITSELAKATGLPENEFDGTYAFTFHHSLWRYDQAERFRIAVADVSYDFINAFTVTDENTIALQSPINGEETILFIKGGNGQ